MKKTLVTLTLALTALTIFAQELPRPSPLGTSTQMVGCTQISLEYSRPGVKGREIFGKLLPYGELWRLGANSATKFTTADTLQIADHILVPGTYALFAIPNQDGTWEVIFNTDSKQSGTADYDKGKDVFRITAKALENSFTETLTLTIDQITNNSATLTILWEKVKVDIPFTVNTMAIAVRNIEAAIKKGEKLDKVYGNAANFYFSTVEDLDKATYYADKAFALNADDYRNLFLKSRILQKKGNTAEAVNMAKKALALAEADGSKGYVDFISSTIKSWQK